MKKKGLLTSYRRYHDVDTDVYRIIHFRHNDIQKCWKKTTKGELDIAKIDIQFANEVLILGEKITKVEYDCYDRIKVAYEIAEKAHLFQFDKAGVDYLSGHLTSVANSCHGEIEKIVGYLHDVAEDTSITEEEVCEMLKKSSLFNDNELHEIHSALKCLNQKNYKSREEYIKVIKGNELAKVVKLKDLQNNMCLRRLKNVTQKDIERVERYKKEYNFLLNQHLVHTHLYVG